MSGIDIVKEIQFRTGAENGETTEETGETLESNEVHEDTENTEEEAQGLPLDVVFDLLKNQRRRRVLEYLRTERETTLSDLAEHVAALENQKEVQQLSSSERKRVYVGLYQCHLPRMDDASVIEFDANRGSVKLNEQAAQLDRYLDVTRRQWPLYYVGIAFAGAVAYVLSWLVPGTTVLASITLLTVIVAISILALFHYRSDVRRGYL